MVRTMYATDGVEISPPAPKLRSSKRKGGGSGGSEPSPKSSKNLGKGTGAKKSMKTGGVGKKSMKPDNVGKKTRKPGKVGGAKKRKRDEMDPIETVEVVSLSETDEEFGGDNAEEVDSVEDAVYEEVEDTLVKIESFESDIRKTKVEIECIKNVVNDELMEEVRKAKIELKRLSLMMKVGFGIVCLVIMFCVVMMMIEIGKISGLYMSSY